MLPRFFIAFSVLCLALTSAYAQASSSYANGNSSLDAQKFELEQKTVQIEEDKLELQRKAMLVTGISIFVPLLIGIYAIRAQARTGFELKAAEIVLNAKNPSASLTKAKALKALFPKRLPDSFASTFDPKKYESPSVESKIDLLKIIAANAEHKQEIITMWKQLFPADEWVNDLSKRSPYTPGIQAPSVGPEPRTGLSSSAFSPPADQPTGSSPGLVPPALPGPKID